MSKGISETAFASQVEDLLTVFKWRWCHFRPAWSEKGWRTPITGDKGLPDYIAVRRGRLIFAELKDRHSKTTPEQDGWLEDLRECVKQITLVPIPVGKLKGVDVTTSGSYFRLRDKELIPSFEVYLWRPSDFNEVKGILE